MSNTAEFLEDFKFRVSQLPQKDLEELYSIVGEYEHTPVHIDEFLDSDRFLGGYFQGGLYPYWREVLRSLYPSPFLNPYWLINLRGSIGVGKTTIACVGLAYDTHLLMCMANPQESFGVLAATKILFAIFNATLALSNDVVWGTLSQMFAASPYFSSLIIPFSQRGKNKENYSLFPKFIDYFQGSRITHTLGRSIYCSLIDEANFNIIDGQVYDTFNSLIRRMESRFMSSGGGVRGKIWVVSSETDKSSAVNQIVDSYKDKQGIYVSQSSLWEVKPHKYGKERFTVFIGSDTRQPSVCKLGEEIPPEEEELYIQVPVEHKDSFDADIVAALRDLAGKPVGSSYRLFRLKEKLIKALCVTPLFPDVVQLDFDDKSDQLSGYALVPTYFADPIKKSVPRHIHVDTAISGDRLGIAASYIVGFTDKVSKDVATFQMVTETVPEVVTEWCLGVEAKSGQQIPLYKIRTFIQWLSKQGYPIGGISFDGYQSYDMMQMLTQMGYSTSLLSVDRTAGPYLAFRDAVYEGRSLVPENAILEDELKHLEVSPDGKKVDHPHKKTKDIADAVCGSVCKALTSSGDFKLFHMLDLDSDNPESMSKDLKNMFGWDE